MKILYLNNVMSVGGVTKCILKLCKDIDKDIEIVVASHGGALVDKFTEKGIRYYEIMDVENKNPINIIKNIKILNEIVKSEKIDIIHSHHRMTTLISKIVSKITSVRVIHTQHLCIEDKFKLTKLALNNIETITVSNAAKKILESKSNLDGKNITTIYNFVNVARETVKENDNIRFVFIGDGPEKQNIEKYILENKLQEYVFMLGSKNNVIEHLKYIDLLILCSYIEGLPLAPIEAFSQGIPVIATDIDGTNEEIKDGYNGYLVGMKNINDFKKRILEIYNDGDLYKEMKKNAQNMYYKYFDKYQYIQGHESIYNKNKEGIINE